MYTDSKNKPTRIGIACGQELGVLFKVKERKHCPEVKGSSQWFWAQNCGWTHTGFLSPAVTRGVKVGHKFQKWRRASQLSGNNDKLKR